MDRIPKSQRVPLRQITTKIGSGATPRGGKESYKADGTPLIRSMNVYDFIFEADNLAYIDQEQARQLDNVTVERDDILLNITGASVARCCMAPKALIPARVNQHVAIIRTIKSVADPRFVVYTINSSQYKQHLLSLAQSGATREALTKETIEKFEISLPSLETQRRISSILSAYDDLIENNIRRIKILEEMAQMIYREWFVNFRFPGHETVRIVESEIGPIPEGWRMSDFGSLSTNLDSKRIPLSSTQRANQGRRYPYYGASGVIDQVESYLFDGLHLLVSEDGENLRSRKTPIAFLADGKFWVNNHAHVVQGRPPTSTAFLFACLKDADISPYLTGTAQPKLSQANLNRIPTLLPQDTLLRAFDELYIPLISLVNALNRKSDNLRTTRDLLLPKLISGEIPVEAADDAVAELMEEIALHA